MVKAYLRYADSKPFGLITAGNSNSVYDHTGQFAICPALEDIIVWNLRQGTEIARWHDSDCAHEVTVICRGPSDPTIQTSSEQQLYAAGYADGSIRLWNMRTNECVITFNGHKGAVTALAFDKSGSKLLSGGRDTDIICWDLVAESGMFRLHGHKDQITWLSFLSANTDDDDALTHILSASKDTLVKCWDIVQQHCVETILGHRSEIWSCILVKEDSMLITGSSDDDIKVFSINKDTLGRLLAIKVNQENNDKISESQAFKLIGNLARTSKERVVQLEMDPTGRHFACQTADKVLEVYQIRTIDEIKKKLVRKKKRTQEKKEKKLQSTGELMEVKDPMDNEEEETVVEDYFVSVRALRASAKIKSFNFRPSKSVRPNSKGDSMSILVALANNSLDVLSVRPDHTEVASLCSIDIPGHRGDIRTMALSSDDEILLTAGSKCLKLWNTESKQCIRTLHLEDSTAICSAFLPGNRHVVVGTKSGTLELYDAWNSTLLESIPAHTSTLWSIDVRPDKRGIVTGGADKEVKFWEFGAMEDTEYSTSTRRLTLTHVRTLQMPDEVLCVKFSPNQELIAMSLLDSTVKVFYADSLKFFLSLYGHKLPVLSLDISSDNTLIVTGSADKNIKLWGLDFGDCHRSIFAHEDSVMQVKFVPQTHYFFSCSKDKTVKYWDGDKFEQIMKMSGHHAELWALCVGRWGNFVVSAGRDKSIRMWHKTDEQLFLEEEREREMEDSYEKEWIDGQNCENEDGSNGKEATDVNKKTSESVKDGERLCDAIAIAEEVYSKQLEYESAIKNGMKLPPPETPAILKAFGNISVEKYVLKETERIKPSHLNQALWIVPFSQIVTLMKVMGYWAKHEWNLQLCSRMLSSIIKIHFNQLGAAKNLGEPPIKTLLLDMRSKLKQSLKTQRDLIGYNLAGLSISRRIWEQNHVAEFGEWEKEFENQVASVRNKDHPKKRKKNPRLLENNKQ